MRLKWVGLYIPGVPPKIVIVRCIQGKMRPEVIENRRRLLNSFVESIAAADYLYRSEEFQLFIRGRDCFEKEMERLSMPQVGQTRKVYERLFQSEAEGLESTGLEEFQAKLGDNILRSKHLKIKLKSLSGYHSGVSQSQKSLCNSLQSYEALCYSQYSDIPVGRIVSDVTPEGDSPFQVLRDWAAGEYLETKSMMEAIQSRASMVTDRLRVEKHREKVKKKLAKKASGKRSFSLPLLSSKRTTKEGLEKDVEDLDAQLADLAVVTLLSEKWLTQVQIPEFKEQRTRAYQSAMKEFTGRMKMCAGVLMQSFRTIGMIV